MGSSPCHTELVYTFIIVIEQVLQELRDPAILHFQMKPTGTVIPNNFYFSH
jgi:hypothetical protein